MPPLGWRKYSQQTECPSTSAKHETGTAPGKRKTMEGGDTKKKGVTVVEPVEYQKSKRGRSLKPKVHMSPKVHMKPKVSSKTPLRRPAGESIITRSL